MLAGQADVLRQISAQIIQPQKIMEHATHPVFMEVPHDYPTEQIQVQSLDDRVEAFTEQVKASQIEWSEPEALQETLKPVCQFGSYLLPNNCAGFVLDVANRMQAPPDFVAAPLMVALSAVIGRKCGIYPKQKDDWLVIPNLWGVTIGRPSAMKSPTLSEAVKPIKRLETVEKLRHDDAMQQHKIELNLQKLNQENIQAKAKAALKDDKSDLARNLLAASLQEIEQPTRKRYIVNDCTIEKLGELLSQNPNGVLQLRNELSGWLKKLGKKSTQRIRLFIWRRGKAGITTLTTI